MWAKVDDKLHSHWKWLESSMAARGLWVTCLSWACGQGTDGFVPRSVVRLYAGPDADALTDELVAAGLWDVTEGGWQIHNFLVYNPSSAEDRARREHISEVRAAAGKRSGEARRSKPEQTAEQNANKKRTKTNPVPDPVPEGNIPPTPPGTKPAASVAADAFDPTSEPIARDLPARVVEELAGCPAHWEKALRDVLAAKQSEERVNSPTRYLLAIVHGWKAGEKPPPVPLPPPQPRTPGEDRAAYEARLRSEDAVRQQRESERLAYIAAMKSAATTVQESAR